jgi:RimJ/RimL family protein N-acetyltransferase
MPGAVGYSLVERLRDGSVVEIRALQQDDRENMLAAIGRTSARSLQRRFFVPKRGFSEREISFFIDIDFRDHVALVAEMKENDHFVIIGGGRYIVTEPGVAEMAFVVIDDYQGKGIGTSLLRHLIELARDAGLKELTADVLPDNTAMLNLFARLGFRSRPSHDPQVRHLVLSLVQGA